MSQFDSDRALTLRVLDAVTARSKVALHNIANQNTPGFKRFTVSFEERLRDAHKAGESGANVHPVVTRDESGPPGENNVDVQRELAMLEKVTLLNEMFARRAGGYFAHLKKAIRGGGG